VLENWSQSGRVVEPRAYAVTKRGLDEAAANMFQFQPRENDHEGEMERAVPPGKTCALDNWRMAGSAI
jgi:hypothetical protein